MEKVLLKAGVLAISVPMAAAGTVFHCKTGDCRLTTQVRAEIEATDLEGIQRVDLPTLYFEIETATVASTAPASRWSLPDFHAVAVVSA